ncbi:hypothetical protein ACFQL7_23010 [Halocatena marina]|uniref:Uncharacterized protein n=1 Tax=Halocatena marina TaxID=2934937 RepID=A0ABD5YT62_9EURY
MDCHHLGGDVERIEYRWFGYSERDLTLRFVAMNLVQRGGNGHRTHTHHYRCEYLPAGDEFQMELLKRKHCAMTNVDAHCVHHFV